MGRRRIGAGSIYFAGFRDGDGAYLDGGKTYKLTVPGPVPGKLFWSATGVRRGHALGDRDRPGKGRGALALREAAAKPGRFPLSSSAVGPPKPKLSTRHHDKA
jgi:hypothetical protein